MTDTSQELVELITDLASDSTLPVAGDLPGLWPKLIELGLTTVGVPERAGGSGGTLHDLVVLVRTLAAQGVSTPWRKPLWRIRSSAKVEVRSPAAPSQSSVTPAEATRSPSPPFPGPVIANAW